MTAELVLEVEAREAAPESVEVASWTVRARLQPLEGKRLPTFPCRTCDRVRRAGPQLA